MKWEEGEGGGERRKKRSRSTMMMKVMKVIGTSALLRFCRMVLSVSLEAK